MTPQTKNCSANGAISFGSLNFFFLDGTVYVYTEFNYILYIDDGDRNMTDKEYEEFVRCLEEVLYEAIDGTEENG